MIEMTRSISLTKERTSVMPDQQGVPWLTVVPLAVLLAYGDGFWVTSLRGAAGAIERTESPFTGWLRESTLLLPVYVCAVLGAVTLALRWFGPVLARPKTMLATAFMIVVAGTLAGTIEIAASSAYDYYLQSDLLNHMGAMGTMASMTAGGKQAQQAQQASLALQVRSVGFGSLILLATNLVLVGWAMAMKGGRLNVSVARAAASPLGSRADDLRLLLAAGLIGAAAIHAAVVPEHLTEWGPAGAFFVVLTLAETAVAGLVLVRREPGLLFAAAVVSFGPLLLWLQSRTVGIPFGPGTGVPEQVGMADLAACALEMTTLLVAVVLVRGRGWLQRPPTSLHVRWLTLVAVVAVAAIGLGGSGLGWFDVFGGPAIQSAMTAPR